MTISEEVAAFKMALGVVVAAPFIALVIWGWSSTPTFHTRLRPGMSPRAARTVLAQESIDHQSPYNWGTGRDFIYVAPVRSQQELRLFGLGPLASPHEDKCLTVTPTHVWLTDPWNGAPSPSDECDASAEAGPGFPAASHWALTARRTWAQK